MFRDFGLGTTIWSPLSSGLLTGKYLDGMPTDTRLSIEGMDWLKERTLGDTSKIDKTKLLNKLANELGPLYLKWRLLGVLKINMLARLF